MWILKAQTDFSGFPKRSKKYPCRNISYISFVSYGRIIFCLSQKYPYIRCIRGDIFFLRVGVHSRNLQNPLSKPESRFSGNDRPLSPQSQMTLKIRVVQVVKVLASVLHLHGRIHGRIHGREFQARKESPAIGPEVKLDFVLPRRCEEA